MCIYPLYLNHKTWCFTNRDTSLSNITKEKKSFLCLACPTTPTCSICAGRESTLCELALSSPRIRTEVLSDRLVLDWNCTVKHERANPLKGFVNTSLISSDPDGVIVQNWCHLSHRANVFKSCCNKIEKLILISWIVSQSCHYILTHT